MATNNFITNTASLKTTVADIRKLDAKKINAQTIFLDGENIRDIIDNATPTIKHSQDTRETVTENDLWGQWVETTEDGTIIVHDDWVTNPNASNQRAWNFSIDKVENNKAYVSDVLYGNIQTEKIKDGSHMFYSNNISEFSSDLPNLTNSELMFGMCSNLTSFSSDLPSLTVGNWMFDNCRNLTSFSSDLSNLTTSDRMFSYCTKLESFSSDLSSLTNGDHMFYYCLHLTTFSSDLSSLTNGGGMFGRCFKLTTFSSDLSSLVLGGSMFSGCSNLTTFLSNLSNLTYGSSMFDSCKLDAESIMFITDSIKDITAEKQLYINGTIPYVTLTNGVYSAHKGFMSNGDYVYTYNNPKPHTTSITASIIGKLTLGIDVTNNSSTIQQQLENFAKEATYDSWSELKQVFIDKGWTVTFQYGGSSTSITYGLGDGEQIVPCQIFAKLVQVEDKDAAQYCTEDASSFYNIEWGHDVTDTTDYTQFNSLEDAAASWNVFPKENIITEEEA